jgi:hypothetical protein
MLQKRKETRWAVFMIGIILINYPILSIFNRSEIVLGVPLTYFYLFLLWLLMIIFTYIMTIKQK